MNHVVITGGGGLVGSNVARACLAADAGCTVEILDLGADPAPVIRYATDGVAGAAERLRYSVVDLTSDDPLQGVTSPETVTHVVHAAAFCHVPEWEMLNPGKFLDVNVEGTRRVLDWVRTLPALHRLIHVSSGGVYGDPSPWSTPEPQREEGPFNPPEVYAISKLAGEQLARRWGELYGLDVRVVRLSAVFGAMERVTTGRSLMSMPYAIARSIATDEPLRISERTLEAGGDFLSAVDVGAAIVALLEADTLTESAYNIAFGTFTPATALLEAATQYAPEFRFTTTLAADAQIDMDPQNRLARWNAYDIGRIGRDTGWAPRPLAVQLGEYLDWVALAPDERAP